MRGERTQRAIALLLKHGADPHLKDRRQIDAVTAVRRCRRPEKAKLLALLCELSYRR